MTIAVGDNIPDVKVMIPTPDGPKPAQTGELLGHGKVVLFAVPGAFTPTCSDFIYLVTCCGPTSSRPRVSTPSPASL